MSEPASKSDAPREDTAPVRWMPFGECAYCDKWRTDPMIPSHTPSERCESGKRPHCTCDTCF